MADVTYGVNIYIYIYIYVSQLKASSHQLGSIVNVQEKSFFISLSLVKACIRSFVDVTIFKGEVQKHCDF